MRLDRASGILAHPSSFPGPHGVGDIGAGAYQFIDWLTLGGQRFWQIMPLSPVGYGDSPYSALSAFAGNPLFISLEGLGFLNLDVPADSREFNDFEVDYAAASAHKFAALRQAFESFEERGSSELRQQLGDFETAQASWLRDFAFFMALKERFQGVSWQDWRYPYLCRARQCGRLGKSQGVSAVAQRPPGCCFRRSTRSFHERWAAVG